MAILALALFVLIAVQTVRAGWRFFHDNEEPVAGGSWGHQLFGRRKEGNGG
jgi:hypothetical protein